VPVSATRGIQVNGMRELRWALKQASAELPKELAAANQEAARIVAKEARRRAPEGAHQGGGKIVPVKQSIRALRQQSKAIVAIGGARSPHAVVTEFGGVIPRRGSHRGQVAEAQAKHRGFRRYGGISVTRVRKQAYVYPALAAKRDEVIDAYGDLIGQLLSKAFPSAA
jgi:hypothetical protein